MENKIYEAAGEYHESVKGKIPIKKGCKNKECFCTGECQEIMGYRDKHSSE
jgi:hypothetical protein